MEKQSSLRNKIKPFEPRGYFQLKQSLCVKISVNEGKSFSLPEWIACNSNSFRSLLWKQEILVFIVKKHTLKFRNEDFINWIEFVNECGFPCTVSENKNDFEVTIKGKDYVSRSHFVSGITAIRYPFYGINKENYPDTAKKAVDEYLSSDLTPHEALCKAHDGKITYFDSGHGIGKKVAPFTREEMIKRCKESPDFGVNFIYKTS